MFGAHCSCSQNTHRHDIGKSIRNKNKVAFPGLYSMRVSEDRIFYDYIATLKQLSVTMKILLTGSNDDNSHFSNMLCFNLVVFVTCLFLVVIFIP